MPERVFDELGADHRPQRSEPRTSSRGRARRDRALPSGALDDRGGDRRGERDPGARDRGEVRPAREAHRRRRRARQRPVRRGGLAPARRARRSTRPRSTSSSTTARSGRTIPSGRRRRGSRTGSAATNAYALEYDERLAAGRRSRCGSRANFLLAEPELRNVLLVAACRESYLLDYANERSRFMFNFGDGAVAGLLDARRASATSCSAATRSPTARSRSR